MTGERGVGLSAMPERSQWYDIARNANRPPSYVSREELFPPQMSDPYGIYFEQPQTAHPLR